MSGKLPDVTDANFDAEVLKAEGATLVDFWAPWCGPCRVVHPVLEEIDAEREDLKIVSLNTDENPMTASRFNVRSIPTLLVLKDGRVQAFGPKEDVLRHIRGASAASRNGLSSRSEPGHHHATAAQPPMQIVKESA